MGTLIRKISGNEYTVANNEVLYAVNKEGKLIRRSGNAGKVLLNDHEEVQYYAVNLGMQNCSFIYYAEGVFNLKFHFKARVLFPTIALYKEALTDREMSDLFLEWAGSSNISNLITEFLVSNKITIENQFFEGNNTELLANELMQKCRAAFIHQWGMILCGVEINRKIAVQKVNTQKDETKSKTKTKNSIYHHIL